MIKNGYLIIEDPDLKETKEYVCGGSSGIKIKMDQEEYYVKYRNESDIFKELFYEEIAKYLKIPTIEYISAIINGKKAIISKNFNLKNEPTKNLYEILKNYKNFMKMHPDLFVTSDIDENYNLETIWWVLLYYYKDHPRKNELVQKLMDQIMESFLFQIISFNYDLNYTNIIIIDNEEPYLSPNFDYERCGLAGDPDFNSNYDLKAIPTTTDQTHLEMIQDFINVSDQFYIEKLFGYIDRLIILDYDEIFRKIEEKIKYQIPKEIKTDLIKDYDKKLKEIKKLKPSSKKRQKVNNVA